MLWLQGLGFHSPVSKIVELIGDEREHPLTLHLGAVAAFTVVLAQLFQLVVQVSHGAQETRPMSR